MFPSDSLTTQSREDRVCSSENISSLVLIRVSRSSSRALCIAPTRMNSADLPFLRNLKRFALMSRLSSKRSAIRNRTMNTALSKQTATITIAPVFADENVDKSCVSLLSNVLCYRNMALATPLRLAGFCEVVLPVLLAPLHGFELNQGEARGSSHSAALL